MLIGMHICRGNFKSTWVVENAYDPAANAIFNQTDIDIYFMEYDIKRAGGLEPLRLLSKGKKRVLPDFITTKPAELEDIDDLRRKFEVASKYADIEQFGIAPQCGFASTEEGNSIIIDEKRRKLDLTIRTAEAIWDLSVNASVRAHNGALSLLSALKAHSNRLEKCLGRGQIHRNQLADPAFGHGDAE
ncbi:MAG: hypothetical protein MO846_04075 [Candidatus Devosia symbiotica]|nr:hypothetical protein [Candidatus Devosia symbiotica]